MKRWALIVNGTVVTVIEQQNSPNAGFVGSWVECTGQTVGPGSKWNGSQFSPADAPVYTNIKTSAFWARFTSDELIAYDVAKQHNPADSGSEKNAAAALRVFMNQAGSSGWLALASTVTFVAGLESSGIVGVGRATVITGTAITQAEAYEGDA